MRALTISVAKLREQLGEPVVGLAQARFHPARHHSAFSSWQIVPTALGRMLGDKGPVKARRVMEAMPQMSKIDIAGLKRAHDKA